MAIHYQNYKRFSAGQGYAGVICRGLGAWLSSERWMAVDCQNCRERLVDVEIISRDGDRGRIERVDFYRAKVLIGNVEHSISWGEIDRCWAPLSLALKAVFGDD